MISIHALREEGDPPVPVLRLLRLLFLSTPSARRATRFCPKFWCGTAFLSTPSARRATVSVTPYNGSMFTFLSTPSARRATAANQSIRNDMADFYPRPPRGGRQKFFVTNLAEEEFLSTPSARRATKICSLARGRQSISIHALREEGDVDNAPGADSASISIHALREEGDDSQNSTNATVTLFLSTPSARRATRGQQVRGVTK